MNLIQTALLNLAFKQLESGEINRKQYRDLYLDIPKLGSSEEAPESIVDFVYNNKGDLGFKLTDDTITQIINQTTHDPEKAATILSKLVGTKANPTKVQDFLRYKLLEVDGNFYIVDMDRNAWVFLFPFLNWILPHIIFKINHVIVGKIDV